MADCSEPDSSSSNDEDALIFQTPGMNFCANWLWIIPRIFSGEKKTLGRNKNNFYSSWADSFARAHLIKMLTRAQNYLTYYIFGAKGTHSEILRRPLGTLEKLAYGGNGSRACQALYIASKLPVDRPQKDGKLSELW